MDKVVAVLVTCNVNQGNSSSIQATFADAVQIPSQELTAPNLQTLFHHLGRKLISAVFSCVANNVVNSPAAVWWRTVFANMLDAPVSKLAMSNDIYIGKDFFNAGALRSLMSAAKYTSGYGDGRTQNSELTLSSSKQFSKMF